MTERAVFILRNHENQMTAETTANLPIPTENTTIKVIHRELPFKDRLAVLFLFSEPGPETGSQPGQGAAQAVGTACHAIDHEGQGKDEKSYH